MGRGELILGERLEGLTLEQKFAQVSRKAEQGSDAERDAMSERIRQITAMLDRKPTADSEAEGEAITPERAEQITSAIITLMSGALPEKLSDRLHDVLDEMASGPQVADTSSNPDMLRVWLPTVLREGGES